MDEETEQIVNNAIPIKYNKNATVVQGNELIRSKQDELTLLEIKLLRLAISQILKDDTELQTYTVKITELAKLLNISKDNIYAEADKLSTDLMRKIIKIEDKNVHQKNGKPGYMKFHWVSMVRYENGVITIKISDELQPYVIGLSKLFTSYSFGDLIGLPSYYSIRLYELLASYQNLRFSKAQQDTYENIPRQKDEIIFSIDYLREYFNCEKKYPKNGDFVKRVIESGVERIDKHTVLGVSYRLHYTGKKITHIIFKVGQWTPGLQQQLKEIENERK